MSYVDPFSENHPIFGQTSKLEELSREKLPTQFELLNVIRGLKKQFVKPGAGPGSTIERSDQIKIYSEIATFLTEIWKTKAKIPCYGFKYSRESLEKHFDGILRYASQKRSEILESDQSKIEYISNLRKTFNFGKCKCFVSATNDYKVEAPEQVTISSCQCKDKDRIPLTSLSFYADQLFNRDLRVWIVEAQNDAEPETLENGELEKVLARNLYKTLLAK